MDDAHRYTKTTTLIFDQEDQTQLAWIDAAIWPNVGSIIELGHPNQDARVTEVRLQLDRAEGETEATILVLVALGRESEHVERRKNAFELAADILDPPAGGGA